MEENIYTNWCFKCGKTFIAKGKFNTTCPDCEEKENYSCKTLSNLVIDDVVVDNEFFSITSETSEKRKTPILHIFSKKSKDEIGQIKWFGAWRKFCFFPNSDTIWDEKCLTELNRFLILCNKEWREKDGRTKSKYSN